MLFPNTLHARPKPAALQVTDLYTSYRSARLFLRLDHEVLKQRGGEGRRGCLHLNKVEN